MENRNNAKEIIFFDEQAKKVYTTWVNRYVREVLSFSKQYNEFANKLGFEPLNEETLSELRQHGGTSLEAKINALADKYDVPALRNMYLEHYYSEFNLINAALENMRRAIKTTADYNYYRMPSVLFRSENLPRFENGNIVVSDDFFENKNEFFETTVSTNSKEYALLTQIKEAYNELRSIALEKDVISGPMTSGRGAGVVVLMEIEWFLKIRNDDSVTINEETLNRLTKNELVDA